MPRSTSRPSALALFDLFFFAHLAIWGLLVLLSWSNRVAWGRVVGQSPIDVFTGLLVALAIELLLWFVIARIGSNVARWVYCIFFLLDLVGAIGIFLSGWWPGGLYGGLVAIAIATQGMAVWVLFVPNADPWFKRKRAA